MKQVFVAQHPIEAHFVRGLLQAEGIPAEVRGEALWGARGEAPVTPDTAPSVWILDDGDEDCALTLIANYEGGDGAVGASAQDWRCPQCGELLEGQFTACWKCGTTRRGTP